MTLDLVHKCDDNDDRTRLGIDVHIVANFWAIYKRDVHHRIILVSDNARAFLVLTTFGQ